MKFCILTFKKWTHIIIQTKYIDYTAEKLDNMK